MSIARMRYVVFLVLLVSSVLGFQTIAAQDGSLVIWTKFNSDSPQNTQDEWMAALIAEYEADQGITIDNVTRPFDTINTDLNLALLSGGDIPDVSYIDATALSPFAINGTLMDLTEFVNNAPWREDVSPAALAACTAPTGEILCVPTITQGTLSYYWTSAFPDGFDGSIEQLASAAGTEYWITGKSAEQFGFEVFMYPLLSSFGVQFADETGMATWASPEAVAGIEWIRSLHAGGHIPDTSLASGFDFENPFKDGSAAAFIAGSWSYVYLNPVVSPTGVEFPADSTSIPSALEAGDLAFAAPIHTAGGDITSFINVNGWAIPLDSPNAEAAMNFINWHMTTERNVAYANAYGGLPALLSGLETETFQTPYWQGVSSILNEYGKPTPPFFDYVAASRRFADTVVTLIQNPDADIMEALMQAQEEYNAEVAAMM
jgi:multiple sugar transport system substrate-binding protein